MCRVCSQTGERERGGGPPERALSAEEEAQEQATAIRRLLVEAQAQHPTGRVIAADDFYTLHVPK